MISALEEEEDVSGGGCVSYTKNFVPRKFDLKERKKHMNVNHTKLILDDVVSGLGDYRLRPRTSWY